jgi:FkbM family methyltransferase
MLRKLTDNRLTRPIKEWIVESIAAKRRPRATLNRWYATLDEDAKSRFHLRYAKIFRGNNSRLDAGEWTVRFAGRNIKLPLRPDFSWLDWDNAVSILGHELEIKQTYAALIASDQRPDLFMDVGANYGMHSTLFLSAGIQVFAFEPNPSCFACFSTVSTLNSFSGRWEPVAVGNRTGTIKLVFPEKETWLGSVSSDVVDSLKGRKDLIVHEAPIIRLDDYLSDIPHGKVLLKIDVEGFELEVLRGASQLLRSCNPKIIFESNDKQTRPDLYRFFDQYDYLLYSLPWRPSTASRPLGIDEFSANPVNNFIAIANDRNNSK